MNTSNSITIEIKALASDFTAIFQGISDDIAKLNAVIANCNTTLNGLVKTFANTAIAANGLKTSVNGVSDAIKNVQPLNPQVATSIKTASDATSTLGTTADGTLSKLKKVGDGISYYGGLVSGFGATAKTVQAGFELITGVDLAGWLKDWSGGLEGLHKDLVSFGKALGEWANSIAKSVIDVVSKSYGAITEFISNAMSRVAAAVAGLGPQLALIVTAAAPAIATLTALTVVVGAFWEAWEMHKLKAQEGQTQINLGGQLDKFNADLQSDTEKLVKAGKLTEDQGKQIESSLNSLRQASASNAVGPDYTAAHLKKIADQLEPLLQDLKKQEAAKTGTTQPVTTNTTTAPTPAPVTATQSAGTATATVTQSTATAIATAPGAAPTSTPSAPAPVAPAPAVGNSTVSSVGQGSSTGGFSQQISQLQEMNSLSQDLGRTFSTTVNNGINSISGNLTKIVEGTETWQKGLLDIERTIVNDILQGIIHAVVQMVVLEAISKIAQAAGLSAGTPKPDPATEGAWGASAMMRSITDLGPIAGPIAFAAELALGVAAGGATAAFAAGGRPLLNQLALVGEQGPELFVPDTAGTILPAHQTAAMLRGGGGSPTSVSAASATQKNNVSIYPFTDPSQMARHLEKNDDHEKWVIDVMAKNIHKFQS